MIFRAKNLSVTYANSKEPALNSISIKIEDGEIIGLVGHNGAGKSTLLKTICNLIEPTTYDDYYLDESTQTSLIMSSEQLYGNLTIIENIKFAHALYKKKFNKKSVEKLLKDTKLLDLKNRLVNNLSTGQKQKVNIVKALSVESNFLILDEPTSGLDPVARYDFYQLLSRVVQNKKITVVFCSHIISEVEKICDRIVMMNAGMIVEDTSIRTLISNYSEYVIEVESDHEDEELEFFLNSLPESEFIINNVFGKKHVLIQEGSIDYQKIQNISFDYFVKRKTSLEDIYMFINSRRKENV